MVGEDENRRIYGRGSCDMKSGVASHIMAVECLLAAGVKPKGDILLDIVVDEEVSGHGTLNTSSRLQGGCRHLPERRRAAAADTPSACIGHLVDRDPSQIQKRYEGISGIELGNKIVKAVEIRGETRGNGHPSAILCPA